MESCSQAGNADNLLALTGGWWYEYVYARSIAYVEVD